tara:strand:- start:1462 stop:1725 length:264 start_codon:yes stop_codon:yes gene_type:complete
MSVPWNGNPSERCPKCNIMPRLGPRRSQSRNGKDGRKKDWTLNTPKIQTRNTSKPDKSRGGKMTLEEQKRIRMRLLELFWEWENPEK